MTRAEMQASFESQQTRLRAQFFRPVPFDSVYLQMYISKKMSCACDSYQLTITHTTAITLIILSLAKVAPPNPNRMTREDLFQNRVAAKLVFDLLVDFWALLANPGPLSMS